MKPSSITRYALPISTPRTPQPPRSTSNQNTSTLVRFTPNIDRGMQAFSQIPRSAMPWALEAGNQIVYLDCATTLENKIALRDIPVPPELTPYTKALSIARRRKCQTSLADIALHYRRFTSEAVTQVSRGVIAYIDQTLTHDTAIKKEIAQCMKKYMFSEAGFGRLGQPKEIPEYDEQLYQLCRQTLLNGALPQILAIHDFMGRVVFKNRGGTEKQKKRLTQIGNRVRPIAIFGNSNFDTPAKIEELRGRIARATCPQPTTIPGILEIAPPTSSNTPSVAPPLGSINKGTAYQRRERGIDKWAMRLEKMPAFTIDVLQRNLVFGSGPSGTTGTLLQAAFLFSELDEELLKQYTLAIVAYLVGGGMHSYHEVMDIAARAGCPYQTGTYRLSLPKSFTDSEQFDKWCSNYYDIAVLGGKSWILEETMPVVQHLNQARLTQFEHLYQQVLIRHRLNKQNAVLPLSAAISRLI